MPGALEAIGGYRSGSLAARLALQFLILTAVRNAEAREARWSEFDLEAATWTIPDNRTKTEGEHRVPLSTAALKVLAQAREIDDGSGFVFPSPRCQGRALTALGGMLKAIGLADRATVHGFRSSFRDWCTETGKAREVAEAALAHTVRGVEGAYF